MYRPQDIDIDPRDRPRSTVIAQIDKLPIIHIKVTANNTMLTITDHNGSTLGWTSAVCNPIIIIIIIIIIQLL